ncbi:MAG: hypothetical protein ACTTJ9_06095 [Segatella oris]|uniref:hypothetical protein n=2 Tax=Prevotellaceae TaxID=171552 RepID=UPI003FA1AA3C
MMKKATRRAYMKPESKVYPLAVGSLLQNASGDHKRINQGGGVIITNAKKGAAVWEEEDEDEMELENEE